jgi:aminotransferase
MTASSVADRALSERAKCVGATLETQTSIPLAGVINLGSGTPGFPTPPHVVEAAKRALDEGQTQYTAWPGILSLREALAAKLARDNGLEVDVERELIVTTGVQEALLVIFLALLDPGDEMLVPSPYYNEYYRDALVAGGRLVTVPTYERDGFVVDPSEIEKRIGPRTKAILINTPGSPTGTVLSQQTLERIGELAQRRDLVVVSDEIYEKFLYDGHLHHSIAALPGMWERTITVNGFSKHYSMTGWRVGYLVGPADMVQKMLAFKHAMTICAPAVSQWAALAALNGPMDWWPAVMSGYEERRRLWMEGLDAMGLTYGQPQGAFYLMVNITSTGKTSEQFAQALLAEERVLVGAGNSSGEEGEGYVRVSFNAPADKLQEGLKRMQRAVTRWRGLDAEVQNTKEI